MRAGLRKYATKIKQILVRLYIVYHTPYSLCDVKRELYSIIPRNQEALPFLFVLDGNRSDNSTTSYELVGRSRNA